MSSAAARSQRECIALHEAAHAVVAAKFGCTVTRVGMWSNGHDTIGGFMRRDPLDVYSPETLIREACNVIDGVVGSAGYAMEELLLGKVSSRSASDDTRISLSLDGLQFMSLEDRANARESFTRVAREQVRDSLPLILELGNAVLRRLEEARIAGLTSAAWSVALEGEELEQLLGLKKGFESREDDVADVVAKV